LTGPWWAAIGPAETTVSCGTGRHRMRWGEGELRAADHPDAEGELVLAALGGDATPCLDLARAWGQHSDDLRALAIGPRSAADTMTITPTAMEEIYSARSGPGWMSWSRGTIGPHGARAGHSHAILAGGGAVRGVARASLLPRVRPTRSRLVHGWGMGSGPGWPGREEDPARAELIWLLSLGTPFQFRLCGTVANAWSADGKHARHRGRAYPALTAALAGRLAPAAAQWLGIDPDRVQVSVHDEAGWGSIELSRSGGERCLRAKLPVSWLAAVWAPGLAVVGRHLVIAVQHAAWPAAEVLALPAPGRQPVELTIRHDGRGWQVAA
jgi:hypothetical protein